MTERRRLRYYIPGNVRRKAPTPTPEGPLPELGQISFSPFCPPHLWEESLGLEPGHGRAVDERFDCLSNPSLAKIEGEVLDIIVLAFPSSLASCWSHFSVPSKPSLTIMQGEVFFPLLQLCPERREEREGLVGVVLLETRTNLNWLDLPFDLLFQGCCLSLARIHTVTSAVNVPTPTPEVTLLDLEQIPTPPFYPPPQ